jgi:hypothetical protein
MSGRRNVMDSAGSTYEDCANLFIGRIASLVRVPREKDFGVDFYCEPRNPTGPHTETVAGLGSLQVKGGSAKFEYGGLDANGNWRDYEFAWLRSLATPLYLVRVDEQLSAVELFSIWPLWWIFWRQAVLPFQVVFTTEEPGAFVWRDPEPSSHPNGAGKGDGMLWTVHLGPPFLRLTQTDLNNTIFRQHAVAILRTWITYDRLTLMRYHQFIPVLTGITGWTTNSPEIVETRSWQFWDGRPGVNIERLCLTAAPMLTNLGVHLQWQNDPAAYGFLFVLEWLDGKGSLDPIGKGLLDGLRKTQAAGVGPAEEATDSKEIS